MSDVDVLVVGGGSVGLAAAVMLAGQGLQVQVVERQPNPSIHPRMESGATSSPVDSLT